MAYIQTLREALEAIDDCGTWVPSPQQIRELRDMYVTVVRETEAHPHKPILVDPQQTVNFLRTSRAGVSQPVQEDLATLASLIEDKRL